MHFKYSRCLEMLFRFFLLCTTSLWSSNLVLSTIEANLKILVFRRKIVFLRVNFDSSMADRFKNQKEHLKCRIFHKSQWNWFFDSWNEEFNLRHYTQNCYGLDENLRAKTSKKNNCFGIWAILCFNSRRNIILSLNLNEIVWKGLAIQI